jgi:UDP-4-amino-4,6-dideoxy-N-acetyl-beta-L-altrosamine N-acetyltransferase
MCKDKYHQLGRLREIKDHELSLMFSWRNAPSVRSSMYTRHEISQSEHELWWSKVNDASDQIYLMYEFRGEPLGIVAFNHIDSLSGNSGWAFYASPDAQRGVGARMEFLALSYCFEDLGLHKLYCEVLEFNESVINLHKKFGFKIEGILREHHFYEDRYLDIYCLALLASEWESLREPMFARLSRLIPH